MVAQTDAIRSLHDHSVPPLRHVPLPSGNLCIRMFGTTLCHGIDAYPDSFSSAPMFIGFNHALSLSLPHQSDFPLIWNARTWEATCPTATHCRVQYRFEQETRSTVYMLYFLYPHYRKNFTNYQDGLLRFHFNSQTHQVEQSLIKVNVDFLQEAVQFHCVYKSWMILGNFVCCFSPPNSFRRFIRLSIGHIYRDRMQFMEHNGKLYVVGFLHTHELQVLRLDFATSSAHLCFKKSLSSILNQRYICAFNVWEKWVYVFHGTSESTDHRLLVCQIVS